MLAFGVIGYRAAPLRLSDGAAGARHRARRPAREESAPRAGAVRRRPDAVLHAADRRFAGPDHRCGVGWKLWATRRAAGRAMKLALCNEVLRHLRFRSAVRARRGTRLYRAGAGAVHRRQQGCRLALPVAQRLRRQAADHGLRDLQPALAAGAARRLVAVDSRRGAARPHRRSAARADRFRRRLRRAGAGARFAEAALAGRRAERCRCAGALHRRLGPAGRTCRAGRRRLLHRAAGAVRDASDQYRGRSRRGRRPDRLAGAEARCST